MWIWKDELFSDEHTLKIDQALLFKVLLDGLCGLRGLSSKQLHESS